MSIPGSGTYQSPWSSQTGLAELEGTMGELEPLNELGEVGFEPQTRQRSNTWPLPRPDNYIEPVDDTGSKKNSNQNLAGAPSLPAPGVPGKKNSSRRNAWGNLSYADLITQAITSAQDKRLTLSQIYEWMVQNVPYFKDKGDSNSSAGWKVSTMFADKAVLITGASSGIGAETAFEFSKLGANLILTGRNKGNLDNVAKECQEYSPKKLKPLCIIADINNEGDVENIIKTTIDHYKQLDVLVNNAGIMGPGNIETTSLAQFDSIMNTNVRGPYHLTMLATPHLIKTKGNIINVSSVAGSRSFPNILAYCVSKSALDQFTRCVALELAPKGVRVNAINPGVIVTGLHLKGCMNEQEYEAYLEKCKDTHALGRPGNTKEVSSVITFLASDAASNITGATLPVDGGRHAMCPR